MSDIKNKKVDIGYRDYKWGGELLRVANELGNELRSIEKVSENKNTLCLVSLLVLIYF